MSRPFSVNEAKWLISEHRYILDQLSSSSVLDKKYRNSIINASNALVAEKVLEKISNIPIEEINRDKRGFRVKALREGGYKTFADVASASIDSIASVYGVGINAARSIKNIADHTFLEASKGAKVQLSTDNKTAQSSNLVQAIARYRKIVSIVIGCRELLNEYKQPIESAIADLEIINGLKWLFASSKKKQKAKNAFEYLSSLQTGDYRKLADTYLKEYQKIDRLSPTEAWRDFTNNPVDYITVLEQTNPGILGNDDTIYGLPEDLAHEIQEESYSLNGLFCTLRRYQEWGVKYILHQERVLLGDEMGLGKTVQAIAAMVSLKNAGATHFMVVCPASVMINWCREIKKMSFLNTLVIHGDGRTAALQAWISSGGVAVTTYETTRFLALPYEFRYSMLVVDEAHYIKNPRARRTMNVVTIGKKAERLLFMTGTALENRVEEMTFLIRILRPEIAAKIQGMVSLTAAPQFRNKVAPVYYRRKREEVLTELPELIESKEWCSLGRREEEAYEKAVLSKNYAQARRVSWNVDEIENSSKAKRLLELVEEAESDGRKVIVYSFFLDTISKISEFLGDRCTDPINGSVTPLRRQEIIDEFDKAPAGKVLIAQILSGGTGLNIQSASVVILCEPQFKPSIENQAISRAYRMGQTRNVLVYRLLCENTVDEKITSVLEDKQAVFDAFADESVAAAESKEMDDRTFSNIIQEEINRINLKREAK